MSDFAFTIVGDASQADSAINRVLGKLDTVGSSARDVGGLIKDAFSAFAITQSLQAIDHAIHAYHELHDRVIDLTNAGAKFREQFGSATLAIEAQREVASNLHATLGETLGVYDAVGDATESLNLTTTEQLRLTENLGMAAKLSGNTFESVGTTLNSLAVAFETGGNAGAAMTKLFKQQHDLGNDLAAQLGMTKAQIVDAAKAGTLSFDQIVRAMATGGQKTREAFSTLQQTYAQWSAQAKESYEIARVEGESFFGGLKAGIDQANGDLDRSRKSFGQWSFDLAQHLARIRKEYEDTQAKTPGLFNAIGDIVDVGKAYVGTALNMAGVTDAWRVETEKQTKATKDLTDEYKKLAHALLDVESASERAIRQGGADRARGEAEISLVGQLESDASFKGVVRYQAELAQLDDLQKRLGLSAEAYYLARQKAFESSGGVGIASSDFNAPGVDFSGTQGNLAKSAQGLNEWQAAQDEMALKAKEAQDAIALKSAEAAQQSHEAWAKSLGSIGRSFLDMALDGEKSFSQMAQSMARDIAMLIVKMSVMNMIQGGGKGAIAGQGLAGLLGFAHGGVIHPGNGGTDSQLVAFRKSPNERVTVETPEQVRAGAMHGVGGGSPNVVINMQNDQRDLVQGMDSYSGTVVMARLNRKMNRRR